jgi:5-methylcytosine-specific restriction protein A
MSTRSDGSFRYDGRWRKVRLAVLERDGHVCQIRGPKCEVSAGVVDHIIPWRVGGALYDPENLRAACATCNSGRVWRNPVRRPSREW